MIELEVIYKECCEAFGVDIKQDTRRTMWFLGRAAFFKYATKHTSYSLTFIGEYMGGRDHATVLHAIKRFSTYTTQYKEFKKPLEQLKKRLNPIYKEFTEEQMKGLTKAEIDNKVLQEQLSKERNKNAVLRAQLKKLKNEIPSEITELLFSLNQNQIQEFVKYKVTPHMKAFKFYQERHGLKQTA